jgi:hypothetical protein
MELQDDIKMDLRLYFEALSPMVKELNPKIKGFVVHYSSGEVSAGSVIGGMLKLVFCNHSYPRLDPTKANVEQFVTNNSQCITRTFNEIFVVNPKRKLTTYNIFYYFKDKSIHICESRIGSISMKKCRIFNEFI